MTWDELKQWQAATLLEAARTGTRPTPGKLPDYHDCQGQAEFAFNPDGSVVPVKVEGLLRAVVTEGWLASFNEALREAE